MEGCTELDPELIRLLVKRVLVYEGRRIEVEMNFAEEKSIYDSVTAEIRREAKQSE